MRDRSLKKREKGAAAIEFAILLPLLILLIAGSVEFGLVMFNKQVITNASREAARAGIVIEEDGSRMEPDAVRAVATNYCQGLLVTFGDSAAALTVDPPSSPDGTDRGDPLIVTVSYQYDFLFLKGIRDLFVDGALGDLTLVAQTTMRYE